MRTDAHISITRTNVRDGHLARHVARRCDSGRAFVATSGLGLPRTWGLATAAALNGFEQGLAETKGRAPEDRLKSAVQHARSALARTCDHLVERVLPDATLVGLLLAEGQLHVIRIGPGRVYLQRAGRPERLTSREDDQDGGLLRARPSMCSTPIEPGDLVLAGSETAFSTTSVAKAMSVLSAAPDTAPAVLASLLTEPAAKAGVGAAAVVLRVA